MLNLYYGFNTRLCGDNLGGVPQTKIIFQFPGFNDCRQVDSARDRVERHSTKGQASLTKEIFKKCIIDTVFKEPHKPLC